MRLRLPELLDEEQITAYRLAKDSGGRISLSTAYRTVRMRGRLANFDAQMLEAMCDVLRIGPGDLFERTPAKKNRRG